MNMQTACDFLFILVGLLAPPFTEGRQANQQRFPLAHRQV